MRKLVATTIALGALALVGAGCGNEAGNPESKLSPAEAETPIAGSPRPLASLRRQAGQLLPGGTKAFQTKVDALRGYPIVVNKWASWCGPCRFEFPHFQAVADQLGDRVAFLGVDSNDDRPSAEQFLGELPLPYPSYLDPESRIAKEIGAPKAFPATAFFDAKGQLVHVRQGVYPDEAALKADVERWAR